MTTLQKHFGLSGQPFPPHPIDAAILHHKGLDEVLTGLQFALERDTIALLISECGCGKSTALSMFAKSLDVSSYQLVPLSLTTLSPFSLITSIATSLGLKSRRYKGDIAAALLSYLRSQPRRAVFIIDEAHLLPDASLEDLRLLTADNFDRGSSFSLVLCGQPLLRDRMTEPRHLALSQRIGVRVRLRPLTESEVGAFLDLHLKAIGATKSFFDAEAVTALFHHSRGIPRLIQNLALASAIAAMNAGAPSINQTIVQQAVMDMEDL